MKKEIIDDIIDGVLRFSVSNPGQFWEMSYLIKRNTNLNDDDIHDLRADIERIIVTEGLMTRCDFGWQINAKTEEVIENGGYIKYKTALKNRAALRELGQDCRDQQDIRNYKYLSWITLGISLFALFFSIYKSCK